MAQYIDSSLFNTTFKITTTKPDGKQQEIIFDTSKFILNSPIGSGKSTALKKHVKESKNYNYIIVVPTTNIANNFNMHSIIKKTRLSYALTMAHLKILS